MLWNYFCRDLVLEFSTDFLPISSLFPDLFLEVSNEWVWRVMLLWCYWLNSRMMGSFWAFWGESLSKQMFIARAVFGFSANFPGVFFDNFEEKVSPDKWWCNILLGFHTRMKIQKTVGYCTSHYTTIIYVRTATITYMKMACSMQYRIINSFKYNSIDGNFICLFLTTEPNLNNFCFVTNYKK